MGSTAHIFSRGGNSSNKSWSEAVAAVVVVVVAVNADNPAPTAPRSGAQRIGHSGQSGFDGPVADSVSFGTRHAPKQIAAPPQQRSDPAPSISLGNKALKCMHRPWLQRPEDMLIN